MKTKKEILEAISQLIFEIESQYPELYRYLDESPETIPSQKHPSMTAKSLENYLEGLEKMLREYKKTHESPK